MPRTRPVEGRRPGPALVRRRLVLRPRAMAVALVALMLMGAPVTTRPAGADAVGDKRAEAEAISAKLAELDARQMDLSAQYERANYALSQADAKVADAQRQADQTKAQLESRQAELRAFSVQAYVTGNDSSAANAILTSEPSAGVEKRAYAEATSGNRSDIIDSLNAARHAAEDDAVRLEQARQEAEAHAQEIDDARSRASDAADEQRALNAKAQGELASLVAEENAKLRAAQAAAASAAAPPTTTAQPGASTTTSPSPARTPSSSGAPAAAPPAPVASAPPVASGGGGAIAAALSKLGAPYVWGAAGPGAFDCSGLVLWAYAQAGVSLPHFSGAQYAMTTRISASQLQPGDLVFWGPGGSEHVAIYMGGNQLVHTFRPPDGVSVTPLAGWWKPPSGYGRINR